MRRLIFLNLIICLVACQNLAGEQAPATLAFELTAYATEVEVMSADIQRDRARLGATIAFAETQAAQFNDYNQVLLATVRQIATPQPTRRIVEVPPGTPPADMMNIPDTRTYSLPQQGEDMADAGQESAARSTQYMDIQTAIGVDANRCPTQQELFFRTNTEIIYLTTTAYDLQPNTRITANWWYEGSMVYQFSWTAPDYRDQICVAMELHDTDVPLQVGNWVAELLANGESVGSVPFTILDG